MRQIKGMSEDDADAIMAHRGRGYDSVRDLWLRSGITRAAIERLADADAFRSLGLDRRAALWAARALDAGASKERLPLFQQSGNPTARLEGDPDLPLMRHSEDVVHDYRTLSFSLKAHPVSFMRKKLERRGVVRCADLGRHRDGQRIEVAGLVLVRQRPGTASGVVFATLEDETGIANIVIWSKAFEAHRRTILASRLMAVRGKLQIEGLVIHVVAESFTDMTDELVALSSGQSLGDAVLARADEGTLDVTPNYELPRLRQEEAAERQAKAALPRGRNFK
jgi:error-prone DNA polymerase